MPLVPVLQRMEARGILVDAQRLRAQTQSLQVGACTNSPSARMPWSGTAFSLDSPKQLQGGAVRRIEVAGAGKDADRTTFDQ
jgi:DNA polymerase-1